MSQKRSRSSSNSNNFKLKELASKQPNYKGNKTSKMRVDKTKESNSKRISITMIQFQIKYEFYKK